MSFNSKTTRDKGGRDPPNVSLEGIVNDLLSYFNEFKSLDDTKTEAEKKYGIIKEHDNCWPADDIKRAWGKTQRMGKTSFRRQHWSLVIMLQVIQKQQAGNLVQRCAEMSVNDTPDQMKAGKRREIGEDDLGSTGDIDQDFVNPKRRKEHPEDISSQSTAEQGTMGAAAGVKQHSGGNPQISSSGQTGGVSQGLTGTPKTVRSQRTGKNRGGVNKQDRPAGALTQKQNNYHREGEINYIRVPLSKMIPPEQQANDPVENARSLYKLIDGLPGPETDSVIRRRKSYVMSFNSDTKNANWVYEILNRSTLDENPVGAEPFGDPYDRGHLAAAANHRWCQEALNDAAKIDNIVPQHWGLNRGLWKRLEFDCRTRAKAQHIRNVHVYSGPLYLRDMNPQKIEGKWVPSHFFKVIIEENESGRVNQPRYYLFPNRDTRSHPQNEDNVEQYSMINCEEINARPIEEILRESGLTFIDIRPNAVARKITGTLQGEDGNTVSRTAEIQVIICS